VPVVSLYLNGSDVSAPQLAMFHSLRHEQLEARREFLEGENHAGRMSVRDDLAKIEESLQNLAPGRMPSSVTFRAGSQLNRTFNVPARTPKRLTIDIDPLILPLDVILASHHKALVVQVTKGDARFTTHHLGHEQQVQEIKATALADAVDESDAAEQRHRLEHLRQHLRSVEQATAPLTQRYGCDVLVLAGAEPVIDELRLLLPHTPSSLVIGTLHPSPEDTVADRQRGVAALLERHRADEEAGWSERLAEARGNGLAASGLAAVIADANSGVIRSLYVSDRLSTPGYICRRHHYVSLASGSCELDGTALTYVEDVVDELVELATSRGVELWIFEARPDLLDASQGVAAVRYPTE